MYYQNLSSIQMSLLILTLLLCDVTGSITAKPQSEVSIGWDSKGLNSLRYGGVDYLGFGDLQVNQVVLRHAHEIVNDVDTTGVITIDPAKNTLTRDFPWGKIVVEYQPSGNRLDGKVEVSNRSENTIDELWIQPLGLRFPSKIREYDGTTPLLTNTLGQPAVIQASYDGGVLVLASHDGKPLQIGFPWSSDRPAATQFPLSINTGRVNMFPNSTPTIRRPIAPHASDTYTFSLRFGDRGASHATLASDVYRDFAAEFPPTLVWPDRRPIGALFLSTAAAGWPNNPRGWLQNGKLRVDTEEGIDLLKARILEYADGSIANLKQMNAQGMITWDIEGQQFPHATSYIGDPRAFETLAPEMRGIADDYFRRFRDAGLRVGVCIRPQKLVISSDRTSAHQIPVDDVTALLIDKATYAKKRWGATLFYVDSNVNPDDLNPMDAAVFKKLAAAFPDALFLPEHSRMLYYAYTAPIQELRQGHALTDPLVRSLYPKAFTTIYTADGPIDARHADLVSGVKQGDILMFRAWFNDSGNQKDSEIYKEAQSAK